MRPSVETDKILDAAAGVVAERGFVKVRMEDLAQRAGVAKGVLYLRFASKSALLAALVDHEIVQATRLACELVEADPQGGFLSQTFTHALAGMRARTALLRLYRDQPEHLSRLTGSRSISRVASRTVIGTEYIRALQTEGIAHAALDAEALATNLAAWNIGLATTAPHTDIEQLIEGMRDVISRGVDTDVLDSSPGKRCFERFATALITERTAP